MLLLSDDKNSSYQLTNLKRIVPEDSVGFRKGVLFGTKQQWEPNKGFEECSVLHLYSSVQNAEHSQHLPLTFPNGDAAGSLLRAMTHIQPLCLPQKTTCKHAPFDYSSTCKRMTGTGQSVNATGAKASKHQGNICKQLLLYY